MGWPDGFGGAYHEAWVPIVRDTTFPETILPRNHHIMNTTTSIADTITPGANMSLHYAMTLASDIPAERWGESAIAGCSHPAFNYAHLAVYPNRMLAILGREDLCIELPFDPELVLPGAACLEDASCYPDKDEVLKLMQEGYEAVIGLVSTLGEDQLSAANPLEGRMADMFPTTGSVIAFMLNNHVMMHMGQVSAWRRAIGLGSAM